MKKSMISMAAVLFAALMTTTMLTSCSKDDDNDAPKKAEFTKAVVKYTVTSDAATLGLFKVNVYGTDADGNGFVETMSKSSYTKTVEIPVSKLPCTVQLYTVATPLEDKVATEAFDFNVQRILDVMTLRSDNTVVNDKEIGNGVPYYDNPGGTSLSEFARKRNNDDPRLVIYIDANGNVTDQTKEK